MRFLCCFTSAGGSDLHFKGFPGKESASPQPIVPAAPAKASNVLFQGSGTSSSLLQEGLEQASQGNVSDGQTPACASPSVSWCFPRSAPESRTQHQQCCPTRRGAELTGFGDCGEVAGQRGTGQDNQGQGRQGQGQGQGGSKHRWIKLV